MSAQSWIGNTIGGRYKIEALLGQGGMSAVYRAYDPNLRRVVAIKLIHTHLSTDPNFIGRFREEAAAIARLRHPNIVQVHDFDLDGETYYMVMEYLVGETIQARLKRLNATGRVMSLPEAIQVCMQICDAAGYAHNHELVHRDIKPANIMLDVHGQAILMDFGIVKIVGGEYHTATGATIGTAMYMSPEQIRGERIDDRADIYSLGVTLYEMISGRPPFQADSALSLMMMVLNDPLPDLARTRPDVPEALAAVVRKALAKDRLERYQSMAEMSAALRKVEVDEVSPTTIQTTVDVPQAEQVPPPGTKSANVSSGAANAAATIKDEIFPAVTAEPPRADQKPTERQAPVPTSPTSAGIPEKPVSAPFQASDLQASKRKKPVTRQLLIAGISLLVLLAAVIGTLLYFNAKRPPELGLTPLAKPPRALTAETAAGMVSLGTWEIDSIVEDLSFSPDGSILGTINAREWLRSADYRFYSGLWQVEEGRLIRYLLTHPQLVTSIAFSPDGQYVATSAENEKVFLWKVQDGSLVRTIEASIGGLTSIDISPNNKLLAAGSWDGIVGLWQIDNGNLLRSMRDQETGILDLEFSPDGSLIAAGCYDDTIQLWSVSDGSLVETLSGHTEAVDSLEFSPDGMYLASASEDQSIGLWHVKNGNQVRNLQGHGGIVKDVSFSPDGSLLASGADDGTLFLWQVNNGKPLVNFLEQDSILSITFSPSGDYLVTGLANRILHFWGTSEAIPSDMVETPSSP